MNSKKIRLWHQCFSRGRLILLRQEAHFYRSLSNMAVPFVAIAESVFRSNELRQLSTGEGFDRGQKWHYDGTAFGVLLPFGHQIICYYYMA